MYSDRNLANRRNVKSDVSAAANPCRRFFQMEVEARITAAAVKVCIFSNDVSPGFSNDVSPGLSSRSAHRLIWNRTVKNKKGSANIPLDLMLEFYNRIIKEAVKKLGPAASPKSLDRISNSLGFTLELMRVFDSSMSVFNRSGKHIRQSSKKNIEKVINALIENRAFTFKAGRT